MIQIAKHFSIYVRTMYSKYLETLKVNPHASPLKLVSFNKKTTLENTEFVIQILGKNIFPKLYGEDFILDISLLNYFNENDQLAINKILNLCDSKTQHKIIAKTYNHATKSFTFKIEYINNNVKKYIQIDDLVKLSRHLHLFNHEDAFHIGLELGKQLGDRH